MNPAMLPTINAALNALSAALLVIGLVLVKRKKLDAHQRCMIGAFVVSCVFLVFYVADKIIKGGTHQPFRGPETLKPAYLLMLASHVLLAMAVPVLAVLLIRLGLTGRLDAHRRLARFAWPIWMYVSVTGIAVYLILWVLYPPPT